MKIRPVGDELFRVDGHTDGRTDGRDKENSPVTQILRNAPKN
jgi:hypothetical protein